MSGVFITHTEIIKAMGRKYWQVMNTFIALMVMVSWVYTYPQTHQVVNIKYAQLLTCQS